MFNHPSVFLGLRRVLVLTCSLWIPATTYGQGPITVDGMSATESALHDPDADVYLVSNISGGPPDGQLTVLAELPQGQLDGVVVVADGSLLVSSFGANAIYHVALSGAINEVISDMPVADIGIDLNRNRVLIPQIDTNRLVIYPVELN